MNRREFTASLGALSGIASLPVTALPAAAAQASVVPPAAYAWAKLIVRAQGKADPAVLARLLRLTPQVAQALFDRLIQDGVLRVPAATGIAQATKPLQSGAHRLPPQPIHQQIRKTWEHLSTDTQPLVKDADPALECGESVEKEATDARTPEPVQEGAR
jgi:hypothetical protein